MLMVVMGNVTEIDKVVAEAANDNLIKLPNSQTSVCMIMFSYLRFLITSKSEDVLIMNHLKLAVIR